MKILLSIILINIVLNQAHGACNPPTDIKAKYDNITDSIKVSWNPPMLHSTDTVTKYTIYVQFGTSGTSGISGPFESTTPLYELVHPVLPSKYRFDVRAYCSISKDYSDVVSFSFDYIGSAVFATIGQEIVSFRWHMTNYTPAISILDVKFGTIQLFTIVAGKTLLFYKTPYKNRTNYKGNFSRTTMLFTLKNVTKADAGYYKSTIGVNNVIGGQVLVVLDKPRQPDITLGRAIVGEPSTLTCNSQHTSVPTYYIPELQYMWFINGSIHVSDAMHQGRFRSHGNTLTITDVQKVDKGLQFTCQSSDHDQLSEMSSSYSIDPLYGPDHVEITPPEQTYELEVGQPLGPIKCTADCNPRCSLEWRWRPDNNIDRTTVSRTNMLSIDRVSRQNEGEYRCIAEQIETGVTPKKKIKNVIVSILYQPNITQIKYQINNYDPSNYDRTIEVSESDDVIITCNADGDPLPEISWNSKNTQLAIQQSVSSLLHEFQSIQCTSSGVYTCTADNGIKLAVIRSIQLRVKCSPRKDNRATATMKYGLKLGDSVNISISVIAYPKPTGTWKTNASGGITEKRAVDINMYTFTYSATVQVQRQTDFGKYWIDLDNKIGNVEKIYFEINAQDRPLVPRNFTVHEVYTEIANLSWISEFDGGQRQIFIIEYSVKGDNSDKHWINVTDEGYGMTINTTIFNLKADTLYHFRLYSRNDIGNSSMVKELEIRTKAYPVPDSQSDGAGGIIAGVVVVAVILVLIVGAIYFLNRRSKKPSKTKIRRKVNRSDAKDKRHTFSEEQASSERQQYDDIDPPTMDTDAQVYQNACRTTELAAEMPYQDLKPEEPHEDRETPYTEIKNKNSPIVTEYIELDNRNRAKETHYTELENVRTELAAEMPYQDLKPEDPHEAKDTLYTEIKNKNSPIVTEYIELDNRNRDKETHYTELENVRTDAGTDDGQYYSVSGIVKGTVTKGKTSDKMSANTRI